MWFLRRLSGEEKIHYLLVGKEYTVGRKNADVLILNDPSISRNHSVINSFHPEANLSSVGRLPVLTLKDVGSKYGTYVNSNKIDTEAVILKVGDKVTFGQCDASFLLCYDPLVITTSCIEKGDKQQLKTLVQRLGGHVLSEWSRDCTHLVMKELKVTIKAVCAMVSLKPLVTKEYFEKLVASVEENKNLPDHERYIPLLGEPILDRDTASFHCKKERQTLFQNKTFICTTPKQYNKLELAITLGGGKVVLMDTQNETMRTLILHPDTCVMKYQSDSSQGSLSLPGDIAEIEEELRNNKKRTIPESDIGLAVVYCSTQHYCNPDFNMASSLFATSKLHSQTLSQQQDIYVEDTQASVVRSTVDRKKSKYGSYVLDTFEKSRQGVSLNTGPQDEIQNSSVVNSQHSLKRGSHFSEPESPTKHLKLQDVVVKEEVDADFCKDGKPEEGTQEVKVKTEAVTPVCNKNPVLEDSWNKLPNTFPDQPSSDAQMSVVKEENPSSPVSPVNLTTEEHNRMDKINICDSKEAVVLTPPMDGFLSKSFYCLLNITNNPREEQLIDKELPTNVTRIEFAPLCKQRITQPANDERSTNNTIRNFKKFRKIYSTGNRLPVIIGGHDLVVYNRSASKRINSLLSENFDSMSQENEETGLFDWDSNKRPR